jgi:hypothetical protein
VSEPALAPARAPHVLSRGFAALPDALTACAYGFTWLFPLAWDDAAVKTLMVVMLLEFLVVHSGAFLGATVFDDRSSRAKRTLALLGFGSFYLLFALAFSLAFKAWWPFLTFVWLLLSRLALVWLAPVSHDEEKRRQIQLWGVSVAAYLGAVFAGVLVPWPALGVHAGVHAELGLSGSSGLWVEKPQTVLLSGMLYFAAMSWSKWKWGPAR